MVLISDEYRRLNREAHKDPTYGRAARFHAGLVQSVIDQSGARTLLDYGCGKQSLRDVITGVEYQGYDPALPGLDCPPEPADIVYCGDVMEHVEPDHAEAVLNDVVRLARVAAVFVISCAHGTRVLGDGKPAHRNVHPPEIWLEKLTKFGRVETHPGVASKPEIRTTVWIKEHLRGS